MARLARLALPGHLHNVTQRSDRAQTFFEDAEPAFNRDLLGANIAGLPS